MKEIITLKNIKKTFKDFRGKKIEALYDIDLSINEGEFFIFLGPSGCGKSTLLRIMSGLEQNFQGHISYREDIDKNDFGFVFQSFAILPWLTVEENVELGLFAKELSEIERKKIVDM